MLTSYINAAMKSAHYEIMEDDKTYYGEVKECEGVYSNAKTLEECRKELEQTLEDWILLRVSKNLPLPTVDGIHLAVKEVVQCHLFNLSKHNIQLLFGLRGR